MAELVKCVVTEPPSGAFFLNRLSDTLFRSKRISGIYSPTGSTSGIVLTGCTFEQGPAVGFTGPVPVTFEASIICDRARFIFDPAGGRKTVYRTCVFASNCTFLYAVAGTSEMRTLPPPLWGNDSKANMQLLRTALAETGAFTTAQLNQMLPTGTLSSIVVRQQKDGGTRPNLFAAYDSDGNVTDYSLNPDRLNEALNYNSNKIMGPFGPAAALKGTVYDVDVYGSTTGNFPSLLQPDGKTGFKANPASPQQWNRFVSDVVEVKSGFQLNTNNMLWTDGSIRGTYFGKKQRLMGAQGLPVGTALRPNTIYRAEVSSPAADFWLVYNGVRYSDWECFATNGTVLTFSCSDPAESANVVAREVIAAPFESIEIIPYDTPTLPSNFPKFSMPLNGLVRVLTYREGNTYGKAAGAPVLFGDPQIVTNKEAMYIGYAITSADCEYVDLLPDSKNYGYMTPVLRYFRAELNLIKDGAYRNPYRENDAPSAIASLSIGLVFLPKDAGSLFWEHI
jgi:hypothetical protein